MFLNAVVQQQLPVHPNQIPFAVENASIVRLEENCDEYIRIAQSFNVGKDKTLQFPEWPAITAIYTIRRTAEADFSPTVKRKQMFHSTSLPNIQPIVADGLKVPQTDGLVNGSWYGVGIYATMESGFSLSYSRRDWTATHGASFVVEMNVEGVEVVENKAAAWASQAPTVEAVGRKRFLDNAMQEVDGLLFPVSKPTTFHDDEHLESTSTQFVTKHADRVHITHLIIFEIAPEPSIGDGH